MDEIGQFSRLHEIWGMKIPMGGVNYMTLLMTWLVMVIIIVGAAVIVRRLKEVPTSFQLVVEYMVRFLDNLVKDTAGQHNRGYLPLIGSLFIFICISNWIGVFPGLDEPTRDLNTTLGLGGLGFLIWHGSGMRVKGVVGYGKEMLEPIFLMFPLNVVGELARVVSISCRLFGNIMGGSIIIVVVSHLLRFLVVPIILNGFFGAFIGTVQAFVFTMLYLTYLSGAIREK